MKPTKEERVKINAIADEIMELLNRTDISLRLKHYVISRVNFLIAVEKYYGEESTYEFLKRIPGLGNSVLRIAEKYPTVIELMTTDSHSLKLIYHVGQKTVQKIYDALISDGRNPRWTP